MNAPLLLMPLFALCLSAVQWWELRKRVHGAWLWMLANGVGGLVWSMLFLRNDSAHVLGFWLLAQGAITGGALLWLFQTTGWHDPDSPIAYYEHVDERGVPLSWDK